MKYLYSLIIVFAIGSSCKTTNKETKVTFDLSPLSLFSTQVETISEVMAVPSDSLGRVLQMIVIDSLLLLRDKYNGYIFNLIDLKTEKMLFRFGRIGKGPGEFSGHAVHTDVLQRNSRTIGAFDRNTGKYSEIAIDSMILNKNYVPNQQMGRFSLKYSSLHAINDSLFVGIGHFDHRYAVSDARQKIVQEIHDYPFLQHLNSKASLREIAMASQGKICARPQGRRLVLATYRAANLEIGEVSNTSIAKIKNIYTSPPLFEGSEQGNSVSVNYAEDGKFGYQDITVTEKYIYALYSGKTIKAYGYRGIYQGNTVLVFDWDGNPVTIVKLDREISALAVNRDNSTMFGFSSDKEFKPVIVKIRLNFKDLY